MVAGARESRVRGASEARGCCCHEWFAPTSGKSRGAGGTNRLAGKKTYLPPTNAGGELEIARGSEMALGKGEDVDLELEERGMTSAAGIEMVDKPVINPAMLYLLYWLTYYVVLLVNYCAGVDKMIWVTATVIAFVICLALSSSLAAVSTKLLTVGVVVRYWIIPFCVSSLGGLMVAKHMHFWYFFPREGDVLAMSLLIPFGVVGLVYFLFWASYKGEKMKKIGQEGCKTNESCKKESCILVFLRINSNPPVILLWCYLSWYIYCYAVFAVVTKNIFLNALVTALVVSTIIIANSFTASSLPILDQMKRCSIFMLGRSLLIPFCVSSFSGLVVTVGDMMYIFYPTDSTKLLTVCMIFLGLASFLLAIFFILSCRK
mmetsp:Transcript_631/g.1080  ORF Transcript_631/g.1080 Transcript_631/m.1080 type:complete len:375 (+) Transcript_631:48-1172(+)